MFVKKYIQSSGVHLSILEVRDQSRLRFCVRLFLKKKNHTLNPSPLRGCLAMESKAVLKKAPPREGWRLHLSASGAILSHLPQQYSNLCLNGRFVYEGVDK